MHGRKSGPGTILTPAEEDILCTYLIYLAQRVFPLTMKMLMVYAWSLAKKYGKSGRYIEEVGPGDRWWSNFCKRHPRITLRKLDKLDRSRAKNIVVNNYLEL